jgi:hypothetical protein
VRRARQVIVSHSVWSSPEPLAFTHRPGDARVDSFPNALALELRELPRMPSMSRPVALRVSMPSPKDVKPTPASVSV